MSDELRKALEDAERVLRIARDAIETGRSEPLYIARDTIRNYFEDRATPASSPPSRAAPDGLRPEVLAFAHLMERELRANDHKPGWKNDDPEALARRVEVEARELSDAVRGLRQIVWAPHDGRSHGWMRNHPVTGEPEVGIGYEDVPEPKGTEQRAKISSEAADVGNMAMMVADRCGSLPALAASPSAPSASDATRCPQCGGPTPFTGPDNKGALCSFQCIGDADKHPSASSSTLSVDADSERLANQLVRYAETFDSFHRDIAEDFRKAAAIVRAPPVITDQAFEEGRLAGHEEAAALAEADNTPGYGPHRADMESLAATQRRNIARTIRALKGTSGTVEGGPK